jgi:hypothetical protein
MTLVSLMTPVPLALLVPLLLFTLLLVHGVQSMGKQGLGPFQFFEKYEHGHTHADGHCDQRNVCLEVVAHTRNPLQK